MLPQTDNGNKKKKTWHGITVDGKPLDSFFDTEKTKEVKAVYNEEAKDPNKRGKRRIIVTETKPKKGRNGKMTTTNQAILNRKNQDAYLTKTKGLAKRIIVYLITGGTFVAEQLIEWEKETTGKQFPKQRVWSELSKISRSALSEYIIKKKTTHKGNIMFEYSLTNDGLELTPAQAFKLFSEPGPVKSKKKAPKKKDVAESPDTGDKPKEELVEIITGNAGSSLNINVNGTVDVVFHFKLG